MSEYRLVTFNSGIGPRAGLVVDESVFDAAALTGTPAYSVTLGIFQDWTRAKEALRAAIQRPATRPVPLSSVKLLAPLPNPGAVYCTGSNYKSHSDAMERAAGLEPRPEPKSQGFKPWVFLKPSRCVVGPDAEIEHVGAKMDWEAELAVVLGKRVRRVSVEEALSAVAAYTVSNDLSARHRFVRPQIEETSPFRFDWVGHKCFDGSCPTGPALLPAEFIGDPQDLEIKLWVNDELKQNSNTEEMIFSIAEQIAQISSLMTLEPGDMILTGTPSGVGAEDGNFLKPGDVVRVELEKLGTLTSKIVEPREY